MAYSWDNRVKFVVRYMYDIDGNGSLDKNDFECLAVRNKDGEVDAKEFCDAVQKNCMNKPFGEMPGAFKAFIDQYFKSIDVDGDGSVGLTEFRVDCVNRMAYKNIADLDAAYNKLLNDED